jgi:hypothetical protein
MRKRSRQTSTRTKRRKSIKYGSGPEVSKIKKSYYKDLTNNIETILTKINNNKPAFLNFLDKTKQIKNPNLRDERIKDSEHFYKITKTFNEQDEKYNLPDGTSLKEAAAYTKELSTATKMDIKNPIISGTVLAGVSVAILSTAAIYFAQLAAKVKTEPSV